MDDLSFPPLTQNEFNQYIEPLGPWGEDKDNIPPIAVAVSGGADSLCLALMLSRWRKNIHAFIVDHQLRTSSGQEAIITQNRLSRLSIPSTIITLNNLNAGAALEERARIARYDALFDACSKKGCLDLLLGHHAGDQAETVLMRIRAGSAADGLAGMALIMDLPNIRLVRPLLSVPPQRLRATLKKENIVWIEDPSNQDMRIRRNQLRKELSTSSQQSGAISTLLQRSREEGRNRMKKDKEQADLLVQHVEIRPEGFALLSASTIESRALGAIIRTISGSIYAPVSQSLERLRHLRSMTVGGVKIQPAGRLGDGWLMFREEAAMQKRVQVAPDCIWDHRFRVIIPDGQMKDGIEVGALGDGYKQFAHRNTFPSALLRVLPALWDRQTLIAVPHLNIFLQSDVKNWQIIFQPKQPMTQSYLFWGI
ncbi:tRNA(Ile)-lysidine synthase TilS/MesJ (TilS) (PDB:1NI5) (PUBMED:21435031) [Commensalibacter communis]|uniref:tRNA lysidine(34) synthetase TilS n=1 Tax=Commensalibacter communis TaxID=2972786 RepID=UPI0022FF738C|nr:tRNA lysidine(34) synthetase TilS [Commensalibacter communis]CAI3924463.1 tRNA(Ile)-lysidine synthase TilS/MesJ (TilS) (PDB:1NI5) (PUBMED:21435031) [Commensalibacter communis]